MKGIKLIELYEQPTQQRDKWTLREIVVNPDYIVCLRPDYRATSLLEEGVLPEGLDERQQFTKVQMDRGGGGLDIVVVGALALIETKLSVQQRQLLKG